jgi:leader peptidase (prepilin peptidase)/N-methyltransferase
MDLMWAAGGAVAGVPVGTALRGPVLRLSVPSGEPDQTTCPECAAPVPLWLAIGCRNCGSSLGAPAALELATAGVLALLLGRFGGQPDVAAFAFLGVLGVALAAIDIAVQRLPDRLTLPAFPVLIVLLAGSAAVENDGGALVRALLGSLALAASYLLLALLRPGQLGGGDIKLAGLAGLTLGWLGWGTLLTGACLGFLLSAVVSLALLATRRITLRSAICFGPFLLGGTLLAILASGSPGA